MTFCWTTPPANPCNAADASTSWGPLGAPGEWVDVPASMQSTTESANKKWQAISKHASRKRRIAAGSGTAVPEVNKLLKQYQQMQTMMKKLKGGGLMKMMRGMKGMMPGMR